METVAATKEGRAETWKEKKMKKKMEMENSGPSLYVCTSWSHGPHSGKYRVEAIRLNVLRTNRLLVMEEEKLLRPVALLPPYEYAYLDEDDYYVFEHVDEDEDQEDEDEDEDEYADGVPCRMRAGVFGSRIVLAGGGLPNGRQILSRYPGFGFTPTFVFETREGVVEPSRFISSRSPISRSNTKEEAMMIPELPLITYPWLREIDGKLYALSRSGFYVFDPNRNPKVWAPLSPLPSGGDMKSICSSFCAVVGTKILVTLRNNSVRMLCFDVAHPEKAWTRLKFEFFKFNCSFVAYYNDALVLDLPEDKSEKLMFTYSDLDGKGRILVSRMMLSGGGEPVRIAPVTMIDVPLGKDDRATRYTCADLGERTHLGERILCFSFQLCRFLLVFVFDFSYKNGSFAVKHRAHREFNYDSKLIPIPCAFTLAGCFVL